MPRLQAWRYLGTHLLLDHPRCRVYEDDVVLPSGLQSGWLRIDDGRDYVKVICVDQQGKILVASQYNHPTRRILHEFPGGQIHEGESFADAARRELQEEMGLYPHQLQELGSFFPNNRRSNMRCAVFVARDFEARPTALDAEENFAFEWLSASEIDQHIAKGEFENGVLLAIWAIYRSQNPA
jgi:ADP-ribose pyrophosphatase